MAQKILFKTELTDTRSTDVEGVGTIRHDEYGNEYRWVRNVNGGTLTQYQAVCYDDANEGANDFLHEVEDPATANLYAFAGIAMAAAEDDDYLWVQKSGINANALAYQSTSTAHSAGEFYIPSDGVTYLGGTSIDEGTAPTYPFGSVLLEDIDTGSTSGATSARVRIIGM